uniref:Uncharacterized protein n=1 Tax=Anguilla anguilla TaxID=7936 RepID=A0A0E9QSL5_ANGAN
MQYIVYSTNAVNFINISHSIHWVAPL